MIDKIPWCLTGTMYLAACRSYQHQRWALVPSDFDVLRINFNREGNADQGITWGLDGLSAVNEIYTQKNLTGRFLV